MRDEDKAVFQNVEEALQGMNDIDVRLESNPDYYKGREIYAQLMCFP